jgi:hypothetical protein
LRGARHTPWQGRIDSGPDWSKAKQRSGQALVTYSIRSSLASRLLPPSLFEHPAAELSVDDSAQLCEDRRQPGHIA